MVISHARRFIYLKTWKTASTSIQAALADVCGEHRLIIDRENVDIVLGSDTPHPWGTSYRARWKFRRDGGHSAPAIIRAFVGRRRWDSYYKFSFVRNPWDTYVSGYWWRNTGKVSETFADVRAEFKRWLLAGEGRRNFSIISIDGNVVADFVGRFENLEEDLNHAREHLGLPLLTLPNRETRLYKGQYRPKGDRYQDYYDAESIAYVAQADAPLIEHFGYEF
jgi:Sulfotransferase family